MELHTIFGLLTAFFGAVHVALPYVQKAYTVYKKLYIILDAYSLLPEKVEVLEARTKIMQNLFELPIIECDNTGACIYVNDKFTEVTGLDLNDCAGDGWLQIITDIDEREQVRNEWSNAVKKNHKFSYVTSITNPITKQVSRANMKGFFARNSEQLIIYVGTL